MAAQIQIGNIRIGAAANCVGLFNGQNMQDNWDSHAPNISASGGITGDGGYMTTYSTTLWNKMLVGQPLLDADYKSNASPLWIGP